MTQGAGSDSANESNTFQKIKTSRQLVLAGLELAERLSYNDLRVEILAAAGGVTAADFNTLFGDLEAFLHVLQLHLWEEQTEILNSGVGAAEDPLAKLGVAANRYLDLCLQRKGARAWLIELGQRSAPLLASDRRQGLQLARRLAPAFSGGEVISTAASRMLMSALREVAQAEARAGNPIPELRRAIVDIIACSAQGF